MVGYSETNVRTCSAVFEDVVFGVDWDFGRNHFDFHEHQNSQIDRQQLS